MSKYLRIVCICVICLFVVEKAEILYPPVWSSNTDNSFNWQSFAMSSSGLWHPGYPDQKDEHRVVEKIFWNGNHNRTGSIVCHKIATKSTSINAQSEGRQPIAEKTWSTLRYECKKKLKHSCFCSEMQINEKLIVCAPSKSQSLSTSSCFSTHCTLPYCQWLFFWHLKCQLSPRVLSLEHTQWSHFVLSLHL